MFSVVLVGILGVWGKCTTGAYLERGFSRKRLTAASKPQDPRKLFWKGGCRLEIVRRPGASLVLTVLLGAAALHHLVMFLDGRNLRGQCIAKPSPLSPKP